MKSFLTFVLLVGRVLLSTPATGETCDQKTIHECGSWVQEQLSTAKTPSEIIRFASQWNDKYSTELARLRAHHGLKSAKPDEEKLQEEISSRLDPVQIAKDKVLEALVKKYFPRLAVVLAIADASVVAGLEAFFWPSQIATDYDEIKMTDKAIQGTVTTKLSPFLQNAWRTRYDEAVKASAGPSIVRP